jgi:ABC-type Zn uptake system ZnuABC Zn-binding protein ZnuA
MKKISLFILFILLSTTIFSCTTDDADNDSNSSAKVKTTIEPTKALAIYEEGPGDDPMPITPPKK